MNIAEIKAAVDAGRTVHWANEGYIVHKDALGQYLITFRSNGSTIGLTDRTGMRLNGDEAAFFVSSSTLGVSIHCEECGSEDVIRDSRAAWNRELQVWETVDLQDGTWCSTCGSEARLVERAVRDYGGGSVCSET